MTVLIACNRCRQTFDATLHMGLVRCDACEEATAPRMQSVPAAVTVL